jgi:hypothetical protein
MLLVSKHEPRSTATLGREATQHSTPRRNKNPITRPKEKLSCILQANSTNQEKYAHTHTQPRKDFSHQKTEPNHNKKRQQTCNQTKQSKNGIPETSTDKKSTHKNTHLQKETSKWPSLSSHLRLLLLLLLLLRPETLQSHKLKRKQVKAKTQRRVRDGYGER